LQILEPPANATSFATNHLSRELKEILKIQDSTPLHELGWYINREMIQNVYQWIVELHSFAADLPLSKDMKTAGVKSVVLEIRFGKDYPMSPPFVRVIRPRFLPFISGGGGHVTGGGAMCMELLTNSGWTAVSSLESVLVQVRMAICNLEPRPARLESTTIHKQRDYGVGEAIEAYERACRAHGWEVPKDFREFAATGGSCLASTFTFP
jgi:ubiquitin-conjugating enzyme E2 Q